MIEECKKRSIEELIALSEMLDDSIFPVTKEWFQGEVDNCVESELVLPAYDYVLKCSHTFNLLDARGVISKDERNNFINRIRTMASKVAKLYVQQREKMGFPLCK